MAEFMLYYQERADGGRRSGLYVDGESRLGVFQRGEDEPDPTLLWYVDLRWETDPPPATGFDARAWVADRSADIRHVLESAANDLDGGIDPDLIPWERVMPTARGPVRVSVTAMRRSAGVEVGRRIRALAASWDTLYPALEPAA